MADEPPKPQRRPDPRLAPPTTDMRTPKSTSELRAERVAAEEDKDAISFFARLMETSPTSSSSASQPPPLPTPQLPLPRPSPLPTPPVQTLGLIYDPVVLPFTLSRKKKRVDSPPLPPTAMPPPVANPAGAQQAPNYDWQDPKRPAKAPATVPQPASTTTANTFMALPLTSDQEVAYKQATTKAPTKVPPVVLYLNENAIHQRVKSDIDSILGGGNYTLSYRRGGKIAVQTASPAAHSLLQQGLREKSLPFVTHMPKKAMPKICVLRGLPERAETELPAALNEIGFPDTTVSKMRRRATPDEPQRHTDAAPYLLQLPATTDIGRLYRVRYLLGCAVQLSAFKPNRSLGTQCHNCPGFGHGSSCCNLTPRCVKCDVIHATRDCPKTDRSTPAVCTNCHEEHPANFRGCQVRVDYVKRIERIREKREAARPTRGQIIKPTTNQWLATKEDFPALRRTNLPTAYTAAQHQPPYVVRRRSEIWRPHSACRASQTEEAHRDSMDEPAARTVHRALVCACVTLHQLSADRTDTLVLVLPAAAFFAQLLILTGEIVGDLFCSPVDVVVDVFYSLVGCCTFATSSVLLIAHWNSVDASTARAQGLSAGALAALSGALMLADAAAAYCCSDLEDDDNNQPQPHAFYR